MFTLNSKVELLDSDGQKIYGLIQDTDNEKIYVATSPDDKEFRMLHIGEVLKVIVYEKNTLLQFTGQISEKVKSNFPTYAIEIISEISKAQRREYVRIPLSLPIFFTYDERIVNLYEKIRDKEIPDLDVNMLEGTIVNLSGGGLRLACREDMSLDTLLFLKFTLDNQTVFLLGKIIHKEIGHNKKNIYVYGIQFIGINEKERERIIRYIFKQMRKNLLR